MGVECLLSFIGYGGVSEWVGDSWLFCILMFGTSNAYPIIGNGEVVVLASIFSVLFIRVLVICIRVGHFVCEGQGSMW